MAHQLYLSDQEIPYIYRSQNFFIMFTKAQHWSVSWTSRSYPDMDYGCECFE